jgi:hypothetical protein
MMMSVATCITPMMPEVSTNRRISPAITAPSGFGFRILDKAGGTTCATSALTEEVGQQAGLTGASPEPVEGPHGEALLAAARAEHFHNANLVDMASAGVYRDHARGPQSWTVASVGGKIAAIGAGDVPILTFAGWLDAGTANGVLSEFTSLRRTRRRTGSGRGATARATSPTRSSPAGR